MIPSRIFWSPPRTRPAGRLLVLGIAAFLLQGPLIGPRPALAEAQQTAQKPADDKRLPVEVTREHTLELAGRTLRFAAFAGSIPLFEGEGGELQAEVAYLSFVRPGDKPGDRPVTFVFNGGPGAASAYLDIGALGPWRLPLDHITPSMSSELVPNGETWLDFTDLVFIDPPGTGYSRVVAGKDGARKRLWSIDGDAEALAVVIRKWVEKAGRQSSPKFIVGESYGGFRAPKVGRELRGQGIAVRGLVMISPVIDFAVLGQRRHAPMSWVGLLPSLAAAAMDADGKFETSALEAVERYAAGDYLDDLLKGERDGAAVERMSARVAKLTGLDDDVVRRRAGRIDAGTFQREFFRSQRRVGSAYDPTVTAFDPSPSSPNSRFTDPVLDGLTAPLTSAMISLYRDKLGWVVERPYRLLEREVSSGWNWGRGRSSPEVVGDLRDVVAADAGVRVMVAHGANDLVTPYFANKILLGQLPVYGFADRIGLKVYAGGHMFYDRDASRRALRDDAAAMYKAAIAAAE
jgi:carboxypeptidase C (cathepsin A)